jgi:hypothetical protein
MPGPLWVLKRTIHGQNSKCPSQVLIGEPYKDGKVLGNSASNTCPTRAEPHRDEDHAEVSSRCQPDGTSLAY